MIKRTPYDGTCDVKIHYVFNLLQNNHLFICIGIFLKLFSFIIFCILKALPISEYIHLRTKKTGFVFEFPF